MEQTLQQQKDKGLRLNQGLGQYFKNEKGKTYKNKIYSGMLARCKTEIPHFLANSVLGMISYNHIKEFFSL